MALYTAECGVSVDYFNNWPEAVECARAGFLATGNPAEVYVEGRVTPLVVIHAGNTIRPKRDDTDELSDLVWSLAASARW